MVARPQSAVERRELALLLTAAWTLGGVLLYLWAPLSAPALLPLCVVAPLGWHVAAHGRLPVHEPATVLIGFALAGVYLLINASWSLSPAAAYYAVAFYFLLVASLHLTLTSLSSVDAAALRAMSWGYYLALVIGGAVVCLEAFSQQWLHRLLMTYVAAFRTDARHMILNGGRVEFLEPFLLNRNATALTLLFWPGMLIAVLLTPSARGRTWLALGLLPALAAILRSGHATSKMALVGAAVTFGAFHVAPALVKRTIVVGWVGAVVLVVPLAALAYESQLYLATWLPESARHRIVIWGHTSHEIAKAPVLGAGIHTARALDDPHAFDVPLAPGSGFRLTTSLHSHNGYLQTWYEAGAIGAVFLLGVGLLLLRSLGRSPPPVQPYMYAAFVACALMSASSFSLWQAWFMASLALAAVFAGLGWALTECASGDRALNACAVARS